MTTSHQQPPLFGLDPTAPLLAAHHPFDDEPMPPEVAERLIAVIRHEQALREGAQFLPERELCLDCALDDDPAAEPGVPQDVVDRSIGQQLASPGEWDDEAWGSLPLHDVAQLACGHTLARLAS